MPLSARIPARAVVTRPFAAPPPRVFDAWLNREMISRWMFGPTVRDEEIVRLSLDPRVGGSFAFVVQRGDEQIDHIGRYLEIVRPRRLVFTWMIAGGDSGSRVLIDIAPVGTGCELTLTHELHPAWAAHVALAETAWQAMLASLAAVLE